MLNCGEVKGKRGGGEGGRISGDGGKSEGRERKMVGRMENEDALPGILNVSQIEGV